MQDAGNSFELKPSQVAELVKLARIGPHDVFYDLGSGSGGVVIEVAKTTRADKAIGIEIDLDLYEEGRLRAINELSKDQLKRCDFWFGNLSTLDEEETGYFYDLEDATVVFYSLNEGEDTVQQFKTLFGSRRARLVTKNLPLVGYESTASRSDSDCWLFLMNYPFVRMRSKREWARSVLGTPDASIDQVYDYYVRQVEKQYPRDGRYARRCLLDLQMLVNERF